MTVLDFGRLQRGTNGQVVIARTGAAPHWATLSGDATLDKDGAVTISTGYRRQLTAARTYYVRTDGSNSNTGLTNTAGGAFLTIQKAVDTAYTIDFNSQTVTIQVATGTYSGAIVVNRPLVGASGQGLVIQGDTATPSNVVLNHTNILLQISDGADVLFKGFKVSVSGGTSCLWSTRLGRLWYNSLEFGACGSAFHKWTTDGAIMIGNGNYTISGNAAVHDYTDTLGMAFPGFSNTVTVSGTPAFATAFALATLGGIVETSGVTYSGSATGPRYSASVNGIISTGGGGANYFPGNSAGSTATGGQYV